MERYKLLPTLGFLLGWLFSNIGYAENETLSFILPDADNQLVNFEDYRGKVVVLHFWATWCPYCKKLQPGLEKLVNEYNGDVVLLGVSFKEDPDATPQQALLDRGLEFRTLLKGDELAKSIGIKGTPTTVFVDKQGKMISFTNTANAEAPVIRDSIEHLLSK